MTGKLRISYSGGADFYNIDQDRRLRNLAGNQWQQLILKTGGYQRFSQIAAKIMAERRPKPWDGIDVDALKKLAEDAMTDAHHVKNIKPLPNRKSDRGGSASGLLLLLHVQSGCPIHQDIPAVRWRLQVRKNTKKRLEVILEKNALPFITGTLCAHNCMNKCTRNFYEESVNIRGTKLIWQQRSGYDELIGEIKAGETQTERRLPL